MLPQITAVLYCSLVSALFWRDNFYRRITGNRVMTVFTTFFSVLANMGIGTAVIQNKELSDY